MTKQAVHNFKLNPITEFFSEGSEVRLLLTMSLLFSLITSIAASLSLSPTAEVLGIISISLGLLAILQVLISGIINLILIIS